MLCMVWARPMAASSEATRLWLTPQELIMAPNQQKPAQQNPGKQQEEKQGQGQQKDQKQNQSQQKK